MKSLATNFWKVLKKLAGQKSEWKTTETRFPRAPDRIRARLLCLRCCAYSALACLHVGMLEWQKIFLGEWTCNDLSDENPQGTPGVVTGPQGWRTYVVHAQSLNFGRQVHHIFLSFSHPQTPHGQINCYNRICLQRRLDCVITITKSSF